jgi:hypothetical protein
LHYWPKQLLQICFGEDLGKIKPGLSPFVTNCVDVNRASLASPRMSAMFDSASGGESSGAGRVGFVIWVDRICGAVCCTVRRYVGSALAPQQTTSKSESTLTAPAFAP